MGATERNRADLRAIPATARILRRADVRYWSAVMLAALMICS